MLAAAIDAKDPYTRGHSERVARYSIAIGKNLSLPEKEMRNLRISALLHDVGKIGIDDRILRKPGALSDDEFEVMKRHPAKGAAIMSGVAQLIDIIPGMKYHHEKWGGGGYPDGLEGGRDPDAGAHRRHRRHVRRHDDEPPVPEGDGARLRRREDQELRRHALRSAGGRRVRARRSNAATSRSKSRCEARPENRRALLRSSSPLPVCTASALVCDRDHVGDHARAVRPRAHAARRRADERRHRGRSARICAGWR